MFFEFRNDLVENLWHLELPLASFAKALSNLFLHNTGLVLSVMEVNPDYTLYLLTCGTAGLEKGKHSRDGMFCLLVVF